MFACLGVSFKRTSTGAMTAPNMALLFVAGIFLFGALTGSSCFLDHHAKMSMQYAVNFESCDNDNFN